MLSLFFHDEFPSQVLFTGADIKVDGLDAFLKPLFHQETTWD